MAELRKAIAKLMEGRPEPRPPEAEAAALPPALADVRARVPAEQRDAAEAFARRLLAGLAEQGVELPAPALAGRVASAFEFLQSRGRSALAARVFRPTAEREGWDSPWTVVETALEDRPFIVATVRALLEEAGGTIRLLVHPILGTRRRPDGSLVAVGEPEDGTSESFVHLEVEGLAPTPDLQQRLVQRLRAVLVVTADYAAMRERLAAGADLLRGAGADAEAAAWLDWLGHRRFVFLGYREYDVRATAEETVVTVRAGSGFGLLRDPSPSRWATGAPVPPALAARLDGSRRLLVSKTTAPSPVHRHAPMEDIAVLETDAAGAVFGVRRFLGLFTAGAYADTAAEMPLLRQQLAAILRQAGAGEGSHDARELTELFNALPLEELLVSGADDVLATLRAVRAAEGAAHLEVLCRADTLGRALIVVVLLPRARFSTELHARLTATLRAAVPGPLLLEQLVLDERAVARLHYQIAAAPEVLATPPRAALRSALGTVLRTWDDALGDTLAATAPAGEAERLAARYREAFSAAYKASTDVRTAALDVRCLEALRATGETQVELLAGDGPQTPTLKLYLGNEVLTLSDFVPVLEHLGLRVLGQDVMAVSLPDGLPASVHSFAVVLPDGAPTDLDALGPRLAATLRAVRAGQTVSDRLHTLVLTAGLAWRAVAVLRAYVAHAHQCGIGETGTIVAALVANPACAQALFAAFAARFDPDASALPAAERLAGPIAEAEQAVRDALAAVPTLAHDRVLRGVAAAVCATVRTNAFATPAVAALALKLDGTRLTLLPPPQPPLETWVHGVTVQGVHLRAGPVARGGIRHSDRPDDFRTEVLGLLRTQIVKNALIVPVGAKGAFVVAPARGERPDPSQVAAAYRDFIDALLSITDAPAGAPRSAGLLTYDGPDPYLVVAADKGTAAFSDLANELAAARGFWLGDAFASGGRHGYDHKRLGITARGAWVCAREHFREMGRDLDRDAVTVAGIGDMSGDVFGNGLLRSRHLRLVAAFDHRHVFLDPAPDAERAYRERQRLFTLPGSSWADYSPAALGPGGGVYAREAKSVPLSPQARALLELEEAEPTGEAVVRAILRLPVDLLWNGGIGTYVKASDEMHEEVDDPGNDRVRIDARELRAQVVAEGGNLGLTQRARIEYALGGGRINTDAIDNSGGVDCSDHEVNLKIALQRLVAQGALSGEERNALLAEVAEPVCDAVLAHNGNQARALHWDQRRSCTQLAGFRDLVAILEAEAGLRSDQAHLPSRETLRLRRSLYRGLTRPELAVLLAHTKLDLRRRLLDSPLCDAAELEPLLRDYFPAAVVERFPRAAVQHPLRREIIAVELANRLVDTMGVTYLMRAVRDGGHDVIDVVRAWLVAWLLIDGRGLTDELAALRDRLEVTIEERCVFTLEAGLERGAAVLAELAPAGASVGRLLAVVRQPVDTLLADWPARLGPGRREAHAAAVAELVAGGVADPLAERIVRAGALGDMLEIAAIAATGAGPLEAAAEAYGAVGERFAFDWLCGAVRAALPGDGRWEPRATAGLLDSVRETRRGVVRAILDARPPGAPVAEAVEAFRTAREEQIAVVAGLAEDLRAAEPGIPALLVLLRELGRLARPVAGATKAWH